MEDSQIVALYWARDEAALAESEQKYGGYCRAIAGDPGEPGGRGGVRQRHVAPGLGGHAAPPPVPAGHLPGQADPQPLPGPLAGPAGAEAGRRADGAGPQ